MGQIESADVVRCLLKKMLGLNRNQAVLLREHNVLRFVGENSRDTTDVFSKGSIGVKQGIVQTAIPGLCFLTSGGSAIFWVPNSSLGITLPTDPSTDIEKPPSWT